MNYIIKKCCYCDKVGDKQPMPIDYAKGMGQKYQGVDLFSHGICDECLGKVYIKEIVKGDKTYGRQ